MKINPLRGTALVVLDPKLVFAVVDNFFGGTGRHAKIEGREFTATEQRIIHMVLRSVFADLREAWSHVAAIEFEYLQLRDQPALRQHRLAVGDRGRHQLPHRARRRGGNLHVTMPYSMIEPLREMLDAGIASDRVEKDERWVTCLREEIEDAEVELTTRPRAAPRSRSPTC